jgi:hypothetical protein
MALSEFEKVRAADDGVNYETPNATKSEDNSNSQKADSVVTIFGSRSQATLARRD